MAKIVKANTEDIKAKDLRREYKRFIGEKKLDYYLTRFERMEEKNNRISFNLSGFICSTFWCFYRKMFVPGALLLALNFLVAFVQMRYLMTAPLIINIVALVIALVPNFVCGFLGNSLYYNYVHGCINNVQAMNSLQKEKYYKENGDTSGRITAGVVGAYFVFMLALFLSYATNL